MLQHLNLDYYLLTIIHLYSYSQYIYHKNFNTGSAFMAI